MASAGTVTVDFAAETAKFTAELKKVRSDLGSVKKDAAAVNQALANFGSSFKKVVGFGALALGIRSVIAATVEAEQAQVLLNNALETAGANVPVVSKEFQALAAQLQRTTTFTDEAVLQVETLLLSFQGLSGETIKRATAAVLDLSTRMGIDAPAAAKLLGKALSDPEKGLTALARAGVKFTDGQKEQIKALLDSGQAFEAQGAVLSALESRFAGAAAAVRNTFGGALAGLKNQVGELFEGKGAGFNAATEAINGLTEVLSDPAVQNGIAQIISGLAKIIELAAKTAAGLAIIFGAGPSESANIDQQIGRLEASRSRLMIQAAQDGDMLGESVKGMTASIDAEIEKLRSRQREILGLGAEGAKAAKAAAEDARVEAALAAAGIKGVGTTDFVTGGTELDETDSKKKADAEAQAQREKELSAAILLEETARFQQKVAIETAYWESKGELQEMGQLAADEAAAHALDQYQAFTEAKIDLDRQAQERANAFQQLGLQNAAAYLAGFGGKYKHFAMAISLIQKRHALTEAFIDTKKAVMTTYAKLGYPWGIPAAIAVAAIGAANIAAIAGVQPGSGGGGGAASSAGGGGGGLATPNNPVFNETPAERGADSRQAVQIFIQQTGFIGERQTQEMIDAIREEIGAKDIILIPSGSRQAQELTGTG